MRKVIMPCWHILVIFFLNNQLPYFWEKGKGIVIVFSNAEGWQWLVDPSPGPHSPHLWLLMFVWLKTALLCHMPIFAWWPYMALMPCIRLWELYSSLRNLVGAKKLQLCYHVKCFWPNYQMAHLQTYPTSTSSPATLHMAFSIPYNSSKSFILRPFFDNRM